MNILNGAKVLLSMNKFVIANVNVNANNNGSVITIACMFVTAIMNLI